MMGAGKLGPEDPPAEAYRRVTDPERFAPLHELALDLLDELELRYAAQRVESSEPTFVVPATIGLARPVALLRPEDPGSAEIEVAWTRFPGLYLRFGRARFEVFPRCGCDACAETLVEEALRFRWYVEQVVAGRFREAEVGDAFEIWDLEGSSEGAASGDGVIAWNPWLARRS